MAIRRPNILWIGVDQMRQDTAGCYGNGICRTPNIDRLAAEGVRFDRAYTPSSLCTPSRASMFTGQFAFRHGLLTNCDMYHAPLTELPRPEDLLHRRLAEMGYACGFVGKSHFGSELGPNDYGFTGFSPPGYGNVPAEFAFREYLRREGLDYAIRQKVFANPDQSTCVAGVWDGPTESTPDHFVTNQALELLDGYAESGAPFFLTCQYWGPHQPYFPSRDYAGLHDRSAIPPWENMDIFPTLLDLAGIDAPGQTLDGRSFRPVLEDAAAGGGRDALYLEFHGIRFLYSQRALVTADGWKYVFTPGDRDEVYDLNADPAELRNRLNDPACAEQVAALREQIIAMAEATGDPLAPCVAKYFGQWQRPGGQPDPTDPRA